MRYSILMALMLLFSGCTVVLQHHRQGDDTDTESECAPADRASRGDSATDDTREVDTNP